MIKIYGMPTCPYCDYVHEQIKGREDEFIVALSLMRE